jgi:hypothetical protein
MKLFTPVPVETAVERVTKSPRPRKTSSSVAVAVGLAV